MFLSLILCSFLSVFNSYSSLIDDVPVGKFVFNKQEVQNLKAKYGLGTEKLLLELVPLAKRNARPPISNYYVGAVGISRTGKIYFGNNLEFRSVPIAQTVHAEQFLFVLSFLEYDRLDKIAVSAEPCGHCRQFLNEVKGAAKDLKVLVVGKKPRYLGSLLPEPFGPDNLDIDISIYSKRDNKIKIDDKEKDEMVRFALMMANESYAPYSSSYSGVVIKTKDGNLHKGFYIENAAFNPSISPMIAAIIKMVSLGYPYEDISQVVLAEKKDAPVKHEESIRTLLKAISPKAKLRVVKI